MAVLLPLFDNMGPWAFCLGKRAVRAAHGEFYTAVSTQIVVRLLFSECPTLLHEATQNCWWKLLTGCR